MYDAICCNDYPYKRLFVEHRKKFEEKKITDQLVSLNYFHWLREFHKLNYFAHELQMSSGLKLKFNGPNDKKKQQY